MLFIFIFYIESCVYVNPKLQIYLHPEGIWVRRLKAERRSGAFPVAVIAIVKTGSWMGVLVSVTYRKVSLQIICILESGLK